MVTSNLFQVYLGNILIASSWSLKDANNKLTDVALKLAINGDGTPFVGQVRNKKGEVLIHREFLQPLYGRPSDEQEVSAPPIFHSH